jgi:superfamily II DNA helicase RecQ
MLRNSRFKKLFRTYEFRRMVVAIVVDEAHVIEAWKDEFRKDYGELETLKVIAGTEIPWLSLTGTCSTKTFKTIYKTLGMGGARPFYGLDLGSDRPNLALWVRPIEFPLSTMADLFVFIPKAPMGPSDFKKTIMYFKTRKLARLACQFCRAIVPPQLRKCLYSFTAVNSENYKDKVMNLLREGSICRMIFATIACGMGTDIPDIEVVVIYGIDTMNEAFQKGGRAGRSSDIQAKMVWLVEKWAFEKEDVDNSSKKAMADRKRRENMDPAAREYINCSQSMHCMREYAVTHFRPQPNLPGFQWYIPQDDDEPEAAMSITWDVVDQVIARGGDCGCSAMVCRKDGSVAVGLLTEADREVISHHLQTLRDPHRANSTMSNVLPFSAGYENTNNTPLSNLKCSKPERENLRTDLISWRDVQWASIRTDW